MPSAVRYAALSVRVTTRAGVSQAPPAGATTAPAGSPFVKVGVRGQLGGSLTRVRIHCSGKCGWTG